MSPLKFYTLNFSKEVVTTIGVKDVSKQYLLILYRIVRYTRHENFAESAIKKMLNS